MMRRRADRLSGVTRLHTPTDGRAADRAAGRRDRRPDRAGSTTGPSRSGSTPPCRCCSPRAAPSVSSSSGPCRTRARTCIPQRDLFPIRIGLRVNEAEHVRLVPRHRRAQPRRALRPDPRHPARRRLRRPDGIPDPVRVRFAWHSDDDHRPAGRPAGRGGAARPGPRPTRPEPCWTRRGRRSTQAQVAERLARPDLGRWLAQVQQVRRCAHPVRLAGTSHTIDTDHRRSPRPPTTPRPSRTGSPTSAAGTGGPRSARPARMSTRATSGMC